jgi:hypothetical protein
MIRPLTVTSLTLTPEEIELIAASLREFCCGKIERSQAKMLKSIYSKLSKLHKTAWPSHSHNDPDWLITAETVRDELYDLYMKTGRYNH